jgi:hypothetical protein
MDARKKTNVILLALIILDAVISIGAFFFPGLWFKLFHNAPYIDPQGFLRRCAANWLAFALIQSIALLKWEKKPYWLAVVAGVRFSDVFTDWTYLYFASSLTMFGKITLFLISPLNLLFGLYFLAAYKKYANK